MGGLLAVAALVGVIWLVGSSGQRSAPLGQPPVIVSPKNYAVVIVPGTPDGPKQYDTLYDALSIGNGIVASPTSGYHDGSPDGSVQWTRARDALLQIPPGGWTLHTYATVYDTTTGLLARASDGHLITAFP